MFLKLASSELRGFAKRFQEFLETNMCYGGKSFIVTYKRKITVMMN